jgi:hypothetical protein
MASASNDRMERDHDEQKTDQQDGTSAARWQQPVSLVLLVAALTLLLSTKVLGSLQGGPFDSVADVGPRPLLFLSLALLMASGAVSQSRG